MTPSQTAMKAETLFNRVGTFLGSSAAIAAAVIAIWSQFLGPGIQAQLQDFVGMTEIRERLDFVEEIMPDPQVVIWNVEQSRQIGTCEPGSACTYILTGKRTPYGADCGKPTTAVPYLRLTNGASQQFSFSKDWRMVELTTEETSFEVILEMPSSTPVGSHNWRVAVSYPSCPNSKGAQDRTTPDFPILVTTD